MTEAAANSRGAMAPPLNTATKHKPSGCKRIPVCHQENKYLTTLVPEPDAKYRKTLMERAAEPYGSKGAGLSSSRHANTNMKPVAASGLSASMSRLPSNRATKQNATRPFGNSAGYGSRAASTNTNNYGTRPKSSYGTHQRSKSHHQSTRPATAMTRHHHEDDESDRKGEHHFPLLTPPQDRNSFQIPKRVARPSGNHMYNPHVHPNRVSHSSTHRTASSFSTSSTLVPENPAHEDCDDISRGVAALSLHASIKESDGSRIDRGKFSSKPQETSSQPKSSSLIPRATPAKQKSLAPVLGRRTPVKTRAPESLTPFLNKFTNNRCPVYDDARVSSLEAQFNELREKMETDMSKQGNLKESMKLYETKSEFTAQEEGVFLLLTS